MIIPGNIRDVTLREMIEAMSYYRDEDVFRWFQVSVPGERGCAEPVEEMRLTVGQVRRELGMVTK